MEFRFSYTLTVILFTVTITCLRYDNPEGKQRTNQPSGWMSVRMFIVLFGSRQNVGREPMQS